MKILICLITLLFTSVFPSKAETNIEFEISHKMEPFNIAFSCDEISLYNTSNVYDDIAETIYEDLLNHKIEIGTINGETMPVIYSDLTEHNINAANQQDFQEIIDNIFSKIDYDVVNSHGEIFYTNSNVGFYGYSNSSGYYLTDVALEFNTDLVDNDASIDAMNAKLTSLVNNFNRRCDEIIAENTEPGMSDVEIILALHDALMKKVSYETNTTVPTIDHRAYSAIIGDVSVCQGYTLAYMHLLDRMGIETKFIPSKAMKHAWNAVKLDNEWYHVDLTWDDTSNTKGSHRFFLVSDNKLEEHNQYESYHHDWEHVVNCNSTRFENGYIFNTPGFTTTYKKGYFWYMKDGEFFKSSINSNPTQINQSDFLPYKESDISIFPAYTSSNNKFSFANTKQDTINITFKNNTPEDITIIPYIIVYNSDGSIDKILPGANKNILSGTTTWSTKINDIVKSNQYIKIFFRNTDNILYPVSNYIEVN